MTKPFLEQLESWILAENFDELVRCEFKVVEIQKNFGRIESEMLADPNSFLWKDAMALACVKDLKKLRTLCKKAEVIFKKRDKSPLTQAKTAVRSGKGDIDDEAGIKDENVF